MNNGVAFSCFSFKVLVLLMLACCHTDGSVGDMNRTQPSRILLVTPALNLLFHFDKL